MQFLMTKPSQRDSEKGKGNIYTKWRPHARELTQ